MGAGIFLGEALLNFYSGSARCRPQARTGAYPRGSPENLKKRANKFASFLRILEFDHLNDEEKESLSEILGDFLYQFYLPGDKLEATLLLTHKIITVNENPIQMKQYRYPHT